MKYIVILFLLCGFSLQAKYLDSKSCQECHEDIYAEHVKSMHHKSSVFSDEVHKKMNDYANRGNYDCALCHTPGAKDMRALIKGKAVPNFKDKRHTDGVSCIYCHQINKIYHAKKQNLNFTNAKVGEKPTLLGTIDDPDDGDKHHSEYSGIYKTGEVCMGCHSHKENDFDFKICNTLDAYDKHSDCIKCHMPKVPGKVEKFNKKGRTEYASHEFLGIRSKELIKKAVDFKLSYTKDTVKLEIENKMGHSIITHPMRLKYVKTTITRKGKEIWSNFKESPMEDKEATFIVVFKSKDDRAVLPNEAVGYKINQNLKALKSKTVTYKVPTLQKGDIITSTWIRYVLNPKVAKILGVEDKEIIKPDVGLIKSIVVK